MISFKKVVRVPRMLLWALFLEGKETQEMVHIFYRHGRARMLASGRTTKPTPEEMKQALEQLGDIPRFLPFFILIAAPLPGVTEGYTLLAVTLENWLGQKVRLLPTRFRNIFQKNPSDPQHPPPSEGS